MRLVHKYNLANYKTLMSLLRVQEERVFLPVGIRNGCTGGHTISDLGLEGDQDLDM